MRKILLAITFTVFLIFFFINLGWFWDLLSGFVGIITPFLIGFLIAYILNFPYKFLYTKAFGKMGTKHAFLQKLRMPLSLVITYVGTFAIIVALIVVLIPQIINNLSNLVKEFPGYVNSAQEMLTVLTAQIAKMNLPFLQEVSVDDMVAGVTNFFMGSQDLTKSVLAWLQSFFSNAATGIYNSLMGIVISIYFLVFKEQLCRQVKKLAVAFIPIKYLPKVYEIVDITDTKCGRFLVGDILDAALLGVIFFVVLTVFNFPYAPLIAVLCGVANIIPFFGPFIGAIRVCHPADRRQHPQAEDHRQPGRTIQLLGIVQRHRRRCAVRYSGLHSRHADLCGVLLADRQEGAHQDRRKGQDRAGGT